MRDLHLPHLHAARCHPLPEVPGGKRGRLQPEVKRKLVLFDIDGTILLSAGAGRRAIHAALASTGIDLGAAGAVRFDGKTDPQIVVEILVACGDPAPEEPGRVAAVLDHYVTHLERDLAAHGHRSQLMPGFPGILDRLAEEETVVLGLLTGNVAAGARLKLAAAGIDPDRFTVGAYGSDHRLRGELPAVAVRRAAPHFGRVPGGTEVVIIGDTPADVQCGAGIGARSIAVATGGFSSGELSAAGADVVFEDLSDVGRAMEAILQ